MTYFSHLLNFFYTMPVSFLTFFIQDFSCLCITYILFLDFDGCTFFMCYILSSPLSVKYKVDASAFTANLQLPMS